jgi:hypothetical protein
MSKFAKYTLIAIGLNILSFILFLVPSFFGKDSLGTAILAFFLVIISLLVQLIVALVYIGGEKKDLGKAMLLCIGIILLIGLSICSQG